MGARPGHKGWPWRASASGPGTHGASSLVAMRVDSGCFCSNQRPIAGGPVEVNTPVSWTAAIPVPRSGTAVVALPLRGSLCHAFTPGRLLSGQPWSSMRNWTKLGWAAMPRRWRITGGEGGSQGHERLVTSSVLLGLRVRPGWLISRQQMGFMWRERAPLGVRTYSSAQVVRTAVHHSCDTVWAAVVVVLLPCLCPPPNLLSYVCMLASALSPHGGPTPGAP
jgi:hypothetical protein